MKRTILALALILCLLLAGCSSDSESPAGTITPSESAGSNDTPAGDESSTEPEVSTAPEESTEPEVSAAPEETTEPEEPAETEETEANTVSMGRMEGGVYTNTYAGYACELDSSWTFYSADELQAIPDNVEALFEGSELGEQMGEFSYFTDMMAENVESLCSMNVQYQQLGMQERLAYAMLSEAEILDGVLEMQDTLIEAYGQAGIIVSEMSRVTVNFAGQERNAIYTVSTMQDVPYYILQIYDFNIGSYSVTLTLSSFIEDQTQSMLELFSAVE